MITVYKYTLNDGDTTIEMPVKSRILTVQTQRNQVCLWAEVDTTLPMEKRVFGVYGTGHPIPAIGVSYIGTVQLYGGDLVLHVYEQYIGG